MEIEKNYKQTDIGIIPIDWEVKSIGEITETLIGKDLRLDIFCPVKDDHHQYPVYSNTVSNYGLYGYYSEAEYTGSSLTIVGRGVGLGTAFSRTGKYGAIGRLIVLFPKSSIDSVFLTEYINHKVTIFSESGGIPQLTGVSIARYRVPVPSKKSEQTAIATALSDADALITSLEKLIAKKRYIKQGAMQELLKVKKGWERKKLGDVATIKARIGWQGLTTAEYKTSGDYFLITGTEFSKGYIDWSKCHYVDEDRFSQDKYIQIRRHDVLVTKDGTIGKVALIRDLQKPATLNSGVFVIRPKDESFDPQFFYYLMLSDIFIKFLGQLSAGSTINHLYQKDFVTFKFSTPKTIPEQQYIARVLTDMDDELIGLESKLQKYHQIKSGMMQNLLTGKIRLV